MQWIYFILIQLLSLIATVLGYVILIPFCLARAWVPSKGFTRSVNEWRLTPLNYVYGNREDGVSGEYALIWIDGVTQGPYMPTSWAPWRAYCWSAIRNSADNLKYIFALTNGKMLERTVMGRLLKAGWQMENGYNVPVISWKKV